ncbi:MAG: hypothetical protein KF764_33700 [Labilithrix sp.]|nr:hypothetical protein [Labilithrix sp.]
MSESELSRARVLRDRLVAMGRLDRRRQVRGASAHGYRLQPPLTRAEVTAIEAEAQIRLPDEYRTWVTTIADGGAGPHQGIRPLREARDGARGELGELRAQKPVVLPLGQGEDPDHVLVASGASAGQVRSLHAGRDVGAFFDWLERWLDGEWGDVTSRHEARQSELAEHRRSLENGTAGIRALDELAVEAGLDGDLEESARLYALAGERVETSRETGALYRLFDPWTHCLHSLERFDEALVVAGRGARWARDAGQHGLARRMRQIETRLLADVGRCDEALARMLADGWALAHQTVGWHCVMRGRGAEALVYLGKEPARTAALLNTIGVARKLVGDDEGARAAYEEALALGPSAAVLDNLGMLFARRKKLGKALTLLKRARSLAPSDPHVLACYGGLLWCKDEPDAAILEVRRALAYSRDEATVREALNEVPADDGCEALFRAARSASGAD